MAATALLPSKRPQLEANTIRSKSSCRFSPAGTHTVNLIINTIPGCGLPPTVQLPVRSAARISDVYFQILSLLPAQLVDTHRVNVNLLTLRALTPHDDEPISTLLSNAHDDLLTLNLTLPLPGGKGGFGSQLRAAGGRMSSRKKRNQGDPNASSRNLDGRRLRTITEAKALAEYLVVRPEMDKKEKEERRKRWEEIVEATERKAEEMRSGKGRVDGKWVEMKDESIEKMRLAILERAAKEREAQEEEMEGAPMEVTPREEPESSKSGKARDAVRVYGWDEDDEFMSDSSEEGSEPSEDTEISEGDGAGSSKGKSKVV
ncbi:hypothetical protein P152DRAFT_462187 [Eremomyces bilateralis CBS 781.70]|uniref:Sde2 N-terminal ubiquitin domain-containing protein n=1 Tax=Eremomyces bilateralis CBS 781.70 TaxID=1392243 RepID=A0A6G1FST8_9PEZI|nr:uncharacterized protein P152DRAFT_462187 [Eremomyces bilateralis CBS 781.70]KAF1808790.1 hypothetical protein P152DRAFT_462187 [Eremomyces bilateralis CBS 781.70]